MGPSPVQPLAMWVDEIFETPATKQKEPFLMSGSYYREDPGDPERLDRTRAQKFRRFVNVGNAQLLEPQYGSHLYSAGRSRWPHALNIPEYETMPGFRLLHFYQFADHDPSHAPQSSAGVSRLFHPTAWIAFEGIVTPGAAMAFGRWYKPDFPDASAGDHRCNILRGHSHRALDGQVSGPAFFWRNASAIPHPHHQLDAFEVPRSQLQADTLEEPEGGGAYGPETAAAMGTGERGGWRMLADLSGMDRADVYGRVDGLNAHLPRLEWEGDVWGPGVLDAEVALGRSGGRMWGGNGLDGELWGRARVWADRVADNIVADLRAARAEGAAVASVASVAGGAV